MAIRTCTNLVNRTQTTGSPGSLGRGHEHLISRLASIGIRAFAEDDMDGGEQPSSHVSALCAAGIALLCIVSERL